MINEADKQNADFQFPEMLQLLDARIREAARHTTDLEAYNTLVTGDATLTSFIHDKLCVASGMFGIFDIEQDVWVNLQTSKYPRRDFILPIDVPAERMFLPGSGESVPTSLVDMLFIAFREDKRLSRGLPEFMRTRTILDERRARPKLARSPTFPSLTIQGHLHEDYQYLYEFVDVGEVSLFLYAWRWLIRLAQTHGLRAPADSPSELQPRYEAAPRDLWSRPFWRDLNASERQALPEFTLLSRLESLRTQSNTTPAGDATQRQRADFLSEGLLWWGRTNEALDEAYFQHGLGFSADLEWLGFLQRRGGVVRGTNAFREMLGFVLNEADYARSHNVTFAAPQEEHVNTLRRHGPHVTEMTYDEIVAAHVEDALRRLIVFLLLSPTTDASTTSFRNSAPVVSDLLVRLHKSSRFLLVPYFYRQTLLRHPLAHVVLGIWSSPTYPLHFADSPDPCLDVAHVILALKPHWDWPNLLPSGEQRDCSLYWGARTPSPSAAVRLQVTRLYNFFQRLAHPMIDRGFYGGLVRRTQQDVAQEEERSAFAHKTQAHLLSLQRQLEKLGVFQLPKGAFVRNLLMFLVATVSMFRRTPHDPSTPFTEHQEQDDPMSTYWSISAAGALQRGRRRKPPTRKDKGPTEQRYMEEPCYETVRRLMSTPDPVAALREVLRPEFAPLPNGAQAIVRTRSFGVMFVHCLTQALYHSLCWHAENPHAPSCPPTVAIAWEGDMLRCRVANPGAPPKKNWEGSKDTKELNDLAKYFLPDGRVWGPMFSQGHDMWITGFDIPSTYQALPNVTD